MRILSWRQKKAIKHIFLVFLFLTVFSAASVYAATYYVAKNGGDSNPGTEEKPWLSLQKAANTVQAGDTVYVKAGTYNERMLLENKSGAPGAYITFQNYGNDEVILDGTGLGYGMMIKGVNVSYIKIIGLTVTNFRGPGIFFNLNAGGGTSSGHIEIRNNTVSYMDYTQEDANIGRWARAVMVVTWDDTVYDIVINDNTVHHCMTGRPGTGYESEAISLQYDIEGFQIIGNTLYDNYFIGINVLGRAAWGHAHNGVIRDNVVHGEGSTDCAAIYTDGGRYITIENNTLYDVNGIGASIGSEESGQTAHHVIFRNNVIYGNDSYAMQIGGYSASVGRVQNCAVVHNVFYNNIKGEIRPGWGSNNVFKNNIVLNTNGYKLIDQRAGCTDSIISSNYNCWYNGNNGFYWKGTYYSTFSEYQTGTGQDANSISQDPLFIDPANADFHLQSNSPCIDRGNFLTKTTSSGSGISIKVEDARYFTDGFGVIEGDLIQVGSNDPVRVVSVDYDTNTITVDKNISWNAGDGVSYPYFGSAPDIGAYEYEGKKARSERS